MNRFLLFLSLFAATALFSVAGCATDVDSLTGRTDPAAADAAPVPGAEKPAPNANSAGWW